MLQSTLVWIGSRKLTSIRTYRAMWRLCAFGATENQIRQVKLSEDMEDYYRIKDGKDEE